MVKYKTGLNFEYPEKPDDHMIDPKPVRSVKLDAKYPYYNTNKRFVIWQVLMNFVFIIIIYFSCFLRYGLKIKGRKYKHGKYRKYFKNGFVTTCNHVFEWDYVLIRSALRCKRGYVVVWHKNHNSSLGKLMRVVGAIPIPDNLNGLKKFDDAIDEAIKDKHMVHFYAEGSMWYYYEGLRPFKKGAFNYAYKNHVPVYPMAISYRPARGLFKLWKRHGYPLATLEICEPQFADYSLSKNEAIDELCARVEKITREAIERNTPLISEKKQEYINKTAHKWLDHCDFCRIISQTIFILCYLRRGRKQE